LAIAAGYDVVLSNSRGPQNLTDLVEELGPQAREATPAGAAAAGDLVVVSIPPRAWRYRWSRWPATTSRSATSGYQDSVARCPAARCSSGIWVRRTWVKVFSNITLWQLASLVRAAGAADRSALPIAWDDPAAKAAVTGFLDVIVGTTPSTPVRSALAARRFQFGTRAFVTPYDTFSDQRGTPAGTAAILAALDA
jgi:hypothetical protein